LIGADLWRVKKVLLSFENVEHFRLLRIVTMQRISNLCLIKFLGQHLFLLSLSALHFKVCKWENKSTFHFKCTFVRGFDNLN
jgi:hypothetical protein